MCRWVHGPIGASETGRRAATIRCTSLSCPVPWAIARALRWSVAHSSGRCPIRVRDRRRRPVLREFPLAGSHLGSSGHVARTAIHDRRVARTIIHRGRAARTIVCRWRVVRWHILGDRTLIRGAVHRRIARAARTQARVIERANMHLGCPLRGRCARDHGAILNRSWGPGDIRSHIHRAKRAVLRRLDSD